MANRIVWQPQELYQPGYSFRILLDPNFAKEMFEAELTREKYERFQKLPKELMAFSNPDPYRFHPDTCFVRQINLSVGDGKWLALDDAGGGAKPDFKRPVSYSTHGFDCKTTSLDVVVLMGLFDLWIEYSDILKK